MYNNTQQQPMYNNSASTISYPEPMYQYAQPQNFDNTYMNQQQPPSYAVASQSQQYSAPMQQQYSAPVQQQQQQQPQNNKPNPSSNNNGAQGTPFSQGYKWPRSSIDLVCPQCGATISTRLETTVTFITIIGAVILLFFTCILACVPFCIGACKNTTHYCPYCNTCLGIRKALR